MRRATFIALCLFTFAVTAGAIWYGLDTNAKLDELRRENRKLIEDMAPVGPSGGAETAVENPVPSIGYRFPIHDADFLMLTSAFGYRISPIYKIAMNHSGLDIAGIWRAQVIAIADGEVFEHWPPPGTRSASGWLWRGHPTRGGHIGIRHADGTISTYSHLSATYIREGQNVQAGQVIGRIGDTGLSTGPHLHLEILVDGKNVNPLLYLPEVR